MTSIDYNEIFESFLGNITEYEFNNLSLSESYALMTEYLQKAVASSYVRHIFSSVTLDDEIHQLQYEMDYVVDEESDNRFVITVLAKQMVYEWIHPQVRSVNLTQQFFGGKEQQFFAQQSHLNQLRSLEEDTMLEVRRMIRDRGYISNTYLDGGL